MMEQVIFYQLVFLMEYIKNIISVLDGMPISSAKMPPPHPTSPFFSIFMYFNFVYTLLCDHV